MKLIENKEGWAPQPDPYIIKAEDGYYYIYATGRNGVVAYRSAELTKGYEYLGIVYSEVGKKEYWAPSVINIDGKYYMYVSFIDEDETDVHQQAIHVAVSDDPRGPFVTLNKLLEPFSIDAHVVQNDDGCFIFYSINDYEAERAGTYIVVDRLITPTQVKGEPKTVVRATLDQEIFCRDRFKKGQHWHTLEGAFYFKEKDKHYLIYSGNCYENEYYYLGYAVSEDKENDLTKVKFSKYPSDDEYRPLIARNEFEAGTGHNSVIKDNGSYYVIYHGRDLGQVSENTESRTARICRLEINGKEMKAIRYIDKV